MAKQRRRTTDAALQIRSAIGTIFSCGIFSPSPFPLPSEMGAQISMTGDILAYGNSGDFGHAALSAAMKTFPSMWNTGERDLERFIARRRFTVLCGECERSVAILGAVSEAVRCGITKIIVTADTPAEREDLAQSFEWMRMGLDGISVTAYLPREYDNSAMYKMYASVYAFLTSDKPEILILGRDTFSRSTNILCRGDHSLTGLLARANPVVFTSSQTVAAGRTLAKIASVFDPVATVVFAGEVRPLRDAVIYKPDGVRRIQHRAPVPEQLGFGEF